MPPSPLILAINALRHFRDKNKSRLSSENSETLDEIETRLLRLDTQYMELLKINDQLMESDPLMVQAQFDPESDTLTFKAGNEEFNLKLNRADPDIPIALDNTSIVSAYKAGNEIKDPTSLSGIKATMESALENFYNSAHRVQKILNTLPGVVKSESRAIIIVRNKLVEHPDAGEFYSFGYSSSGPIVRPMHRPGREWVDAGLIPNTKEFADVLIRAFTGIPKGD